MSSRNRRGINPIIIVLALALIFVGGFMSIPREGYADIPDSDNDGVADAYDREPFDPEIKDEVPPNELDPDDPYYDPIYEENPYEPSYPKPNPKERFAYANIFGGGSSLSLGNMILFIGIGLFFVGLFIGRK